MTGPEHHQAGADVPWGTVLITTWLLVLASGYLVLSTRASRAHPQVGWSRWRTAFFLIGLVSLAVALLPPVASSARGDFRGHMLQHLLIGMYAPLALVLAAPITLLLRTLPTRHARTLSAVLRSRPVHLLANPITALVLSVGALPALYFTPLYGIATSSETSHWLLHLHFLLAGGLFAWVIASPDPAPARPGVPARLVVLGVAITAHATISQLMYGGFFIDIDAPVAQVQDGAELMYYGGDIAELMLAAALVATWQPDRRGRRPGPKLTGVVDSPDS